MYTDLPQSNVRLLLTFFAKKRQTAAVKNKYERLKVVYQAILEFEKHIGNGGGDGNEDSAEDTGVDHGSSKALHVRINKATSGGKQCTRLTGKVLKLWQENSWYDLFNKW